jgi:hypothetical protein
MQVGSNYKMTELTIKSDKELIELAYSLGQPISSRVNSTIIDHLVPTESSDAHPQSLSANFGIGNFPFHTDGAYFKIPPRFIIMRYLNGIPKPTPTVICDLNQLNSEDKGYLKHSIWKVKSRNNEFLSTILSDDETFFRYDRCVMTPVISIKQNESYFESMIDELPKTEINWTINKVVIINNWTTLHTRPKIKEQEVSNRTIQRIMVL